MSHTAPALRAQGVSARLGGVQVLHPLDLQLEPGRWTSIVGPNGAGKSTLLKVLAGLLPHQGSVSLDGRVLSQWSARERARTVAWLGQGESVVDDLSVLDLVMLGRLPHQPWLGKPDVRDLAVVEKYLRLTQAWEWRHRSVGALSGGERQRVLLARALSVEADILLMDEPLANLDPPHQADWLQIVRGLRERGTTVVSVLHEISMALQADALVVMAHGRITHHGACADLNSHRALEQVFDQRISIHAVHEQWVAIPTPSNISSHF
jgi:iron complex transport system ATP-binding protein